MCYFNLFNSVKRVCFAVFRLGKTAKQIDLLSADFNEGLSFTVPMSVATTVASTSAMVMQNYGSERYTQFLKLSIHRYAQGIVLTES